MRIKALLFFSAAAALLLISSALNAQTKVTQTEVAESEMAHLTITMQNGTAPLGYHLPPMTIRCTDFHGLTAELTPGLDDSDGFDINQFYIDLPFNQLILSVGKRAYDWSVGHFDTTFLSTNAPGYMQIGYQLNIGAADYQQFVGQLSASDDTFLLGHRLRLRPFRTLQLGVNETAIAKGWFLRYPVNYLPLWPYYLTQHLILESAPGSYWKNTADETQLNDGINVNLGIEAAWNISRTLQAYGEVFVDDYPMKPGNRQLKQAAFLAGIQWNPAARKSGTLISEYLRVNNFTYTHQTLSTMHQGRILGAKLGPDADSFRVQWQTPHANGQWSIGLEYRRRGEGRPGDVWEDLARETSFEEVKEYEFLSGNTIEHSTWLHMTCAQPVLRNWQGLIELSVGHAVNYDNIADHNRTLVNWKVGLQTNF